MIKRVFQDITNLQSKNIKLTIHKSSHRKKLLRWIYEVCGDFRYSSYTYITTLIIIDAYTEKNGFDINEYQLIGISALFLSAKIEEPVTKKVKEYSLVTDNGYSVKEIIEKEKEILELLEYNIKIKLPHSYFNLDYFRNNFLVLEVEEKREILNCIIAALMERSSYTKNMFLLYLEAVREMEMVLNSSIVDPDVQFYLDNNKPTRGLLNKIDL